MTAPAIEATWLSYTPGYTTPRGRMTKVLGAHAFAEGAERSVCGYAPRSKAGGQAMADARRCVWCERVLVGMTPRMDGLGPAEEVTSG